ncbi:hypothetical protein [Gilliamella sp. Pas-s25]|uniref:hypothetical protein n=1 Tax=Gilliamella sp. Pas-s25 TaxID=2687310 RepID=UPI00135D5E76|nr:hypothetical protein [Gilliamella sp. Pas-s25]MWP62506.1 hypothetical protein [Gilliamella sp. Pas-s25]
MALILLSLLSFSLNSQALSGQNSRGGNRSDAIILPSLQWGVIKSVMPELVSGSGPFAGPADIWNPNYGFLVQSTDPASYALNFPTTGADGLYFDLIIMGEASELTWTPVTHEGITATVTRKTECNRECDVEFRVTLTGPEARAKINNPHPSLIAKPRLPQTFELVGRDSNDNEVVRYGFVLQKWFVNRGDKQDNYPNTEAWCRDLGYRVPQVKDLTNAVCLGMWEGDWCKGSVGAIPSSSGNHYQRQIGAGFFSEWGGTYLYAGAGFVYDYQYWTSDTTGNTQFDVDSDVGDVYFNKTSNSPRGICATP